MTKRESLRDDGTEPVSVAILRTVLRGRESEFEAGLQEFFARAATEMRAALEASVGRRVKMAAILLTHWYYSDGSVRLVLSPTKPAGVPDANWIQTNPEKGFFAYFRWYSPTKGFFHRSWKMGNIVESK